MSLVRIKFGFREIFVFGAWLGGYQFLSAQRFYLEIICDFLVRNKNCETAIRTRLLRIKLCYLTKRSVITIKMYNWTHKPVKKNFQFNQNLSNNNILNFQIKITESKETHFGFQKVKATHSIIKCFNYINLCIWRITFHFKSILLIKIFWVKEETEKQSFLVFFCKHTAIPRNCLIKCFQNKNIRHSL